MRPRPDVALIAPYPPRGELHGGHSGVASYTANLARNLAAAGVNVTVVAGEIDGGEPAVSSSDGIEVRRAFRFGPTALPAAVRAARALRPGVVHLQWELFLYGGPSALPGLLPALAAARHGAGSAPLVTTLHQVVDPAEIDRGYARLHRVAAPASLARAGLAGVQAALRRGSDALVVHEERFREVVPEAAFIPHGVELGERGDPRAARAALGLDDRLVALCFGFIAPYKGLEVVLDAAEMLRGDVDVVVAGGEHPRLSGAHGFAAELRRRYGSVARFTGRVPDEQVSLWFQAADVALFPYPRPFSSSGAVALALAHRTPMLLSPAMARCIGAPRDVTVELAPVRIAARLRRMADERGVVSELARWSDALGDGRDWPAVAHHHARLYEEVRHGGRRDAIRSAGRGVRARKPWR